MTAAKPEQDLEGLRQILLQVRDWGNGLAKQQFDDDPLPGMSPEKAEKAIMCLVQAEVDAAEKRGMNRAKSRVLRRTEIPKDARNPTRDAIVILGEEIASFIDQDIAELHPQDEDNLGMTNRTAYRPTYPDSTHPPQQPPTEGGSDGTTT